jgi:hypothetical protein
MKKEVKKGILLVTMLAAMISYASEPSTFEKKNEIKTTTLSIHSVKLGQQLIIKDDNGLVLYRELIKQSGTYNKGFDLTALPNGNYYFELDKDVEIRVIPFKVYLNTVEFLKEKETTFFKPVVRFKDNKILLSRLSLDYKPLEVNIYYEGYSSSSSYELIHTEKFKDTKIVERVYALDKSKKGMYKVVVKTEGKVFTETMTL